MPKKIVADTCFWFALFEASDAHHDAASALKAEMEIHQLVVPWPTLYETLNTRFFRKRHYLTGFKEMIERPGTALLEDEPYREASLRAVLDMKKHHAYSLVDQIIRSMILDRSIRIDALITFNAKDLRDVCDPRSMEILYR